MSLDSSIVNNCYDPSVALDDSGNVHIVWVLEVTPNYNRLVYRRYAPGEGWGSNKRLSKTVTRNDHPVILELDGTLHVVWRQLDRDGSHVCYRRFTPGSGWDTAITKVNLAYGCSRPSIAADASGNLHVVWTVWFSDEEQEIAYRGHTEGSGWDPGVYYVTPNDTSWSERPTVACDDSANVHVLWQDARHGQWELYERVLAPGVGWRDEVCLTGIESGPSSAHLRTGPGGDLHLVWENSRDLCCAVYYRRWETQSSSIPPEWAEPDESVGLTIATSPNPSSGVIRVALYPMSVPADIAVGVYDVRGRLIRDLFKGDLVGSHEILWDCCDNDGYRVPPGLYFCVASTRTGRSIKKVVLSH